MRIAYETSEMEDSIDRIERECEFLSRSVMEMNPDFSDSEFCGWLKNEVMLLQDDLNRTEQELESFSAAITRCEQEYLKMFDSIRENTYRLNRIY